MEDELLNLPGSFGRGWLLVPLPPGHVLQFIRFHTVHQTTLTVPSWALTTVREQGQEVGLEAAA